MALATADAGDPTMSVSLLLLSGWAAAAEALVDPGSCNNPIPAKFLMCCNPSVPGPVFCYWQRGSSNSLSPCQHLVSHLWASQGCCWQNLGFFLAYFWAKASTDVTPHWLYDFSVELFPDAPLPLAPEDCGPPEMEATRDGGLEGLYWEWFSSGFYSILHLPLTAVSALPHCWPLSSLWPPSFSGSCPGVLPWGLPPIIAAYTFISSRASEKIKGCL